MNFFLKQIRTWFMFAAVRYFAQPATQAMGGPSTNPIVSQTFAANGTADINGGPIVITQALATTVTIPAPVAGQDDFKRILVFSSGAFAHVLSFGANKLNGNKTSWTWTKAVAGLMCELVAFNGTWFVTSGIADVAAYAQQATLA